MRLLRQLQPAFAAFLAACVLALGMAAVSPDLHEWICAEESHAHHNESRADHGNVHVHKAGLAHDDHHANSDSPDKAGETRKDHVCAVTLFAHGCTASLPAAFVSPPVLNATCVAHFTELMLARTLCGPARVCGPPALT